MIGQAALQLIYHLAVPLVLTIFIEGIIAFLLGYRDKITQSVIMLVNIITNPILNFVLLLLAVFMQVQYDLWTVIGLEVLVVAAEWALFSYALKKSVKQALFLSICLNTSSCAFGFLLFWVNW